MRVSPPEAAAPMLHRSQQIPSWGPTSAIQRWCPHHLKWRRAHQPIHVPSFLQAGKKGISSQHEGNASSARRRECVFRPRFTFTSPATWRLDEPQTTPKPLWRCPHPEDRAGRGGRLQKGIKNSFFIPMCFQTSSPT